MDYPQVPPVDLKGMTQAEARVAIMYDVLAHVKAGRFLPAGGWLVVDEITPYDDDDFNDGEPAVGPSTADDAAQSPANLEALDLCAIRVATPDRQLRNVLAAQPTCKGCVVAAIVYAIVLRFNALRMGDISVNSVTKVTIFCEGLVDNGYLLQFFTKQQLALMEFAYENDQGRWGRESLKTMGLPPETIEDALEFIIVHNSDEDTVNCDEDKTLHRLVTITHNVIFNKGEFVPANDPPDGWEPPPQSLPLPPSQGPTPSRPS